MPDSATPFNSSGTWLGFDFGLRRIGVAVGQSATLTANPLVVVRHGKQQPDWDHIERLIKEWRPQGLVVGLPLGKEGEETPLSNKARYFARQLRKRHQLEVVFCDERLTSRAAQDTFNERRAAGVARRREAGKLDAMAASIILENWLQANANDKAT